MRYLTKSRFTTAISCPTKLKFLDNAQYANSNATNEFLLALADGGHQIGALAKCLFPDGIEVNADGHDAQVEQTAHLLESENVVLFEAAFRVENLFVRVDLLRKVGRSLELYEVKSKSYNSDLGLEQVVKKTGISSEFKPYIYDVAFQRHVLRKTYGTAAGIASLNFKEKAWVVSDGSSIVDPYKLLDPRFNDVDLDDIERFDDGDTVVSNGGAAMVAYALFQSLPDGEARTSLERQLLRYCELDTLAMVMAYEGMREMASA